jgi:hypothetical protein
VWHPECYKQWEDDPYPRVLSVDDDEMMLDAADLEERERRFKQARPGDVLMCPFQFDTCLFVNIQKRPPVEGQEKDDRLMRAIRRASLDAFWAREAATVDNNLKQLKHVCKAAEYFGVKDPIQEARGPYPVADDWGVLKAVTLLHRSLDGGRNTANVQFGTVRKLRSFYSNFFHTTPNGVGLASLATDSMGSSFFSESPT